LALKYAVNLATEKSSLDAISIAAKSVLFVASANDKKALLKKGWEKAVASESEYVTVEGEHSSILTGTSFEQICDRLKTDLAETDNVGCSVES
jgi:thioesterase domain-containing protein